MISDRCSICAKLQAGHYDLVEAAEQRPAVYWQSETRSMLEMDELCFAELNNDLQGNTLYQVTNADDSLGYILYAILAVPDDWSGERLRVKSVWKEPIEISEFYPDQFEPDLDESFEFAEDLSKIEF